MEQGFQQRAGEDALRPDSVTRGGAKVAAERQPVAPGTRRTAASIAATSLILSSMVVRLSGPNRITTSSGTVAPSFSSSQRVMGMTGVSGAKSRISWIEVRIRGSPIAPTVMAARHMNRTTPRCLTTHRPRPGKIPRWDSGPVAPSS